MEFVTHDMGDGFPENIDAFDMVGFAAFTDYGGPSEFFLRYVRGLPEVKKVPSFVVNTYAGFSGHTLKVMKKEVEKKGFDVLAGHSVKMPENYPPSRKRGIKGDDNPDGKEMKKLDGFIRKLNDLSTTVNLEGDIRKEKVRIGLLNYLYRPASRDKAGRKMGPKKVDESSCIRCGKCADVCVYGAIELDPLPVFEERSCFGCFACYNLCPTGAISTEKFKGDHRYTGPSEKLRRKLSY